MPVNTTGQGNISISSINTENAATTSNSLKTLSETAVEGLSTLNEGPFAMSEFSGYTHTLQTVSNTQNWSGTRAANFIRSLTTYNGFGAVLTDYQLVMKTTSSGSNYVATLYVEETSNGLGSYNGSTMSTGTLYPIQTVTFTQGNWPDSYALDHSVAKTSSGGGGVRGQVTTLTPGTGETHAASVNWDNTTFTLLDPTTGTAFKVRHQTTAECFTGETEYIDTIVLKFIKSGFPTLTAATFTIITEHELNHSGICP